MLPVDQLSLFAAIVCLGIFTQAATGFAGGLVIMPLMLWAGYTIPDAQAALLVSTIPQNAFGVYRYRETLDFRLLALPGILRLSGLPIGTAMLFMIHDFPADQIRQIVSGIVIMCVLLLLCFRPEPREHLHVGWTWLAFLTSGFFQGCTGTGGPMMVLWVHAHDWSTKRTRAFLFFMYLISIIPAWGLLYFWFRDKIFPASLTGAALFPLLLVSTWIGLRVGTMLGRERLKTVTIGLLLVIGLTGVCSPMIASLLK